MISNILKKYKDKLTFKNIIKICFIIFFPLNILSTIVYDSFIDDSVEKAVIMEAANLKQITDGNVVIKYKRNNNFSFRADIIVGENDKKNLEVLRNYLRREKYRDENGLDRKGKYYIKEYENKADNTIVFKLSYRTGKKTLLQEWVGI